MRLRLKKLHLDLRKSIERIDLQGTVYFYGPIGSGKSSIGRLIDYCLGGSYEWNNGRYAVYGTADASSSLEHSKGNYTLGGTLGVRMAW